MEEWEVHHGLLQAKKLGNPVVPLSKKLQTSEQKGPMIQFQFKAECLEIPWRVTGQSLHSKAKKSGIWYLMNMVTTKK
jgi:hypothetical protein